MLHHSQLLQKTLLYPPECWPSKLCVLLQGVCITYIYIIYICSWFYLRLWSCCQFIAIHCWSHWHFVLVSCRKHLKYWNISFLLDLAPVKSIDNKCWLLYKLKSMNLVASSVFIYPRLFPLVNTIKSIDLSSLHYIMYVCIYMSIIYCL